MPPASTSAPVTGDPPFPDFHEVLTVTSPVGAEHHPTTHEVPARHTAVLEGITRARLAGVPLDERVSVAIPPILLRAIHTKDYLERLAQPGPRVGVSYRFSLDVPIGAATWNAALHAAGAAALAVRAMQEHPWCRRAFLGVRPPGHHATASEALGYCYLNNAAMVARLLVMWGLATRVAIIDVDAHHGNGTEALLDRLPGTVYGSVHGLGYPGTGRSDLPGRAWNRAIPWEAGPEAWSPALHAVLDGVASHRPEALVISFGTDGLAGDPVADLGLSQDDLDGGVRAILARFPGVPVVSVLEGGYAMPALTEAVRRHLITLSGYEPTTSSGHHP